VSGATGIELGPSSCVLVRTGRDGFARPRGVRAVTAARRFDARDRALLARVLRNAREEYGFSERARVVAWSAPGSQVALDLEHLPDISPIVAAGFDVEAIVSVPQALALMLESRRVDSRSSAVAAVAATEHGAAIAVVHHGEVVAARTFHWTLGEPFGGDRPELLERYLVVSQLAPHLRHLIELAGPVYHAKVSSIVMCGSLPDLRSLSMLLIEEMDMEVETLDTPELLSPAVVLTSESPASLQLAAAVSTSAEPPPAVPPDPPAGARSGHAGGALSSSPLRQVVGSVAFVLCAAWASMQVAGSAPAAPLFPEMTVVSAAPPAAPVTPPRASNPQPEATIGRIEPVPSLPVGEPPPTAAARPAATRRRPSAEAVWAPRVPALPPDAAGPLPRVDGVVISSERRLAIVNGTIVSVGDRIAGRLVKRIDRDGVVLQEPGGREVLVAIRTRKPPPGGL
jgi:hypothetical protein